MSALLNSGHSKIAKIINPIGRFRPQADASREGMLITIKEKLRGRDVGLKGTGGVPMDSHTPSLIKA